METITLPAWIVALMLSGYLLIPLMWWAATRATIATLRRRGLLRSESET